MFFASCFLMAGALLCFLLFFVCLMFILLFAFDFVNFVALSFVFFIVAICLLLRIFCLSGMWFCFSYYFCFWFLRFCLLLSLSLLFGIWGLLLKCGLHFGFSLLTFLMAGMWFRLLLFCVFVSLLLLLGGCFFPVFGLFTFLFLVGPRAAELFIVSFCVLLLSASRCFAGGRAALANRFFAVLPFCFLLVPFLLTRSIAFCISTCCFLVCFFKCRSFLFFAF